LTKDGIAEIMDAQPENIEEEEAKTIMPERRPAHDVDITVDSEAIQFPCIDVSRFCKHFGLTNKEEIAVGLQEDDPDWPQGTVEKIASIQPLFWNKYHQRNN
jgi:hypothetical protein